MAGDYEAYVHADFLHRSSFNTTATNSIYGFVPGYGVVNGRIGVRSANPPWRGARRVPRPFSREAL